MLSTPGAVINLVARRSWNWPVTFQNAGMVLFCFDVLAIWLVGLGASIGYHLYAFHAVGDVSKYAGLALAVSAGYAAALNSQALYAPASLLDRPGQLSRIVLSWASLWAILLVVAFSLKIGDVLSRGAVALFALGAPPVLIAQRLGARALTKRALRSGAFRPHNVAVLELNGARLPAALAQYGVVPACQLRKDFHDADALNAALRQFCRDLARTGAQEAVVTCRWSDMPELLDHLSVLHALPVPVRVIPDGQFARLLSRPITRLGDVALIETQRAPLGAVEQFVKRCMDLTIAASAIVLLAPLLAAIAWAIRYDSPGPIFFKQRRRGFNGRIFQILKFRSMTVTEDGEVVQQAQKNDPRVTNVGRFIRRTSLDELPQLFNVLRGEMSLIGPRPHAVAHDNLFDELIADYARRRKVKPGLTGWAQINGLRGETPTLDRMTDRVRHDLWYIDNWSLGLDLKILLLTAKELFRSPHAY